VDHFSHALDFQAQTIADALPPFLWVAAIAAQ
jgi:hypothetical protein